MFEDIETHKKLSKWIIGTFTACILIYLGIRHISHVADAVMWLKDLLNPQNSRIRMTTNKINSYKKERHITAPIHDPFSCAAEPAPGFPFVVPAPSAEHAPGWHEDLPRSAFWKRLSLRRSSPKSRICPRRSP